MFKFSKKYLKGKKLVAFGDSVTADATIGCPLTYPNLIKNKFKMSYLKNYAIGGTTATYMFKGSNIYKEYKDNEVAIDGCRVVKRAVENNELHDVDFAFIYYGHNDQFFQPDIDNDEVKSDSLSLSNCKSFKASYRYMINMLKQANPNIQIILLNCTYSEYDREATIIYGQKYKYIDYRNAIKEIADEFHCIYIDPWDHFKKIYLSNKKPVYYKDFIHLTIKGQKELFKFIIKH